MTQPVAPQQPPAPPAPPFAPAQAPAPRGVGAAPSSITPPPVEKGYIERAVLAIRDLIVWIFSKLCFCCFKNPSAAAPPTAPAVATPPAQQPVPAVQSPQPPAQSVSPPLVVQRADEHRAILDGLYRTRNIRRDFETYFPTEAEKDEVYYELGRTAPLSYAQSVAHSLLYTEGYRRRQRIQIGKEMVEQSPSLLRDPLIQKIEAEVDRIEGN